MSQPAEQLWLDGRQALQDELSTPVINLGRREVGPADLERLADEWLRALRRQGFSPNTEKSYGWALNDFRRAVAAAGVTRSDQVRPDHVEGWQDSQAHRGVSASSRAGAATAVRKWLQWMAITGRPVDPNLWISVQRVRTRRRLPRPLEERDLSRLLLHLNTFIPPGPDLQQLRDRALVLYLVSTGARISEVLQVRRDELERAIVWRKGGREGVLQPASVALEAVADYLSARGDPLPWLWVGLVRGRPSGRLTPEGLRHVARRLATESRIARFSPHQLRHSTGTLAYDETGDPLATAELLDHSDLRTIRNYAKVSGRRKRAVVEALDRILRELQGGTAMGGTAGTPPSEA